eukprot:scaffold10659_cov36-Prasinocladus_malaysianus.AAC.1
MQNVISSSTRFAAYHSKIEGGMSSPISTLKPGAKMIGGSRIRMISGLTGHCRCTGSGECGLRPDP